MAVSSTFFNGGLPCKLPIFQGYVRGHVPKKLVSMVQYPCFRVPELSPEDVFSPCLSFENRENRGQCLQDSSKEWMIRHVNARKIWYIYGCLEAGASSKVDDKNWWYECIAIHLNSEDFPSLDMFMAVWKATSHGVVQAMEIFLISTYQINSNIAIFNKNVDIKTIFQVILNQ